MQFLVAEGARLGVSLIGVIGLVAVNALFLIWMERKVSAHMQLRPGPMEVGFHGALQTIADALKLIGKELITPEDVDKLIYLLAPIVMFLPVLVSFVVIPFSPHAAYPGSERRSAADLRLQHPVRAGHSHGRLVFQ